MSVTLSDIICDHVVIFDQSRIRSLRDAVHLFGRNDNAALVSDVTDLSQRPPYKVNGLIDRVPGLVLADFEWAEVVLDFYSESSAGAGSAVTLSIA